MKSHPSFRSIFCVRWFGMVLAMAPTLVFGATISQTLHFDLNSNSISTPLAFTPFDPADGNLQSVQVSFDNIVLTQEWWLWNRAAARQVSYTATLSGAYLMISDGANSQSLLFDPILYGGTTSVLNRVNPAIFQTELAYLTQGIGSAPPAADYFQSVGYSPPPPGSLSGSLPVESFNPNLTMSFDPGVLAAYDPGTLQVLATNVFIASQVSVAGDITVTYVTVPEGMSSWAFLMSLAAMAAARRFVGRGMVSRN
jgi:hypothetical protein